MTAAARSRKRQREIAEAKRYCPSCGDLALLSLRTGFCRTCTNEHDRAEMSAGTRATIEGPTEGAADASRR